LNVTGKLSLSEGFEAQGSVDLAGATIGGDFDGHGGHFRSKKNTLVADRIKVNGGLILGPGFEAGGTVRLRGATIGGDFDGRGGHFSRTSDSPQENIALNAERIRVDSSVLLGSSAAEGKTQADPFQAEGEVILTGASIGGDLNCQGGQFNGKPRSLSAEGLAVKQSAFFSRGFRAQGRVSLFDASIGSFLVWEEPPQPPQQRPLDLNLQSAKVGILWHVRRLPTDGAKQQLPAVNPNLDGFVYDQLYDGTPDSYTPVPADANADVEWLRLQSEFHPQPYQQLADFFRKDGRDDEAKEILIAKERKRWNTPRWSDRLLSWILRNTIGYGYRPWRAVWLGLVIVLIGWCLFKIGYRFNLIIPEKQPAYESNPGGEDGQANHGQVSPRYPRFSPLIYSIDVFTPVLDLYQRKYWMPDANGGRVVNLRLVRPRSGALLRWYFWFQTIMGWTLTTLLVVGLTGLVHS
jgi:hypothetical protein